MQILLFLFLFAIFNTRYGSADEQLDRTKRGLDFFKFLPSFNFFNKKVEKPVTLPPLYPIWKVHKYNGVQLKPVSLAELSKSIIRTTTELPAPTKSQILPSIEQLKLLLGTTSDAETFDALKELASTRGGLRMVAGFIKANIENAKVLATASNEPESETEKYQYSVPAEDEKVLTEESTDAVSSTEEVSSAIEVSSDDADSSTKEETHQHPLHLGLNYVKSVFSSKPKIFIPPKIFVLPKAHSKQKFVIQPTLNESKSDANLKFNSSFGSNSHFENNGQSFLKIYGVPSLDSHILNFTQNEASAKFNSNLFKESSSGSSNKITSGSFPEEYGLPSVEYGTPKFFSNQDKFSQQFQVPSNTYGVPQIENVGSVIITDIPKPHTIYGNPKTENNQFKMENKSQIDVVHKNQAILKPENERIIPFPILPSLPSLPEPESLTKFHASHLPGKSVFSFTGPVTYKTFSSLKKKIKNIVASKFEQPGFSYTQLDQLPLEEGIHLKKTFGQVSSYGDDVSSHVFDIDNVPAPSSYKSRRVKPDVKKTKGNKDENSTTISPKRRWVPKLKRKYDN